VKGEETLYLDASALVKRYIQEPGSEEVTAFLRRDRRFATAAITKVEMAAAPAKMVSYDRALREAARREGLLLFPAD